MINTNMPQYTIVKLEEVDSTNSYALENILFLEDKTVIYTTHQTLGRGRYNRKWVCDNSENLYMSIVLKPENTNNYPFPNLTQYLSVVVCNYLRKTFGLDAVIKWPNDILVNSCKISGILAESYMMNGKINAVVLGLGLNVNLSEETLKKIDQKATSLLFLNSCKFSSKSNIKTSMNVLFVDDILKSICNMFFENYNNFTSKGFSFFEKEYINYCSFLGKNITIKEQNSAKEYFAKSINKEGLLIVNDKNNNEYKIITGDVLC